MSVIGLVVYTFTFVEFAHKLSFESEEFYSPTDDPETRAEDVQTISNVLANLSTRLSASIAQIGATSTDRGIISSEASIIALALRGKVLADELVVALAPLEHVTPQSNPDVKQVARNLWEEDRQAALQTKLNEIRQSLSSHFTEFMRYVTRYIRSVTIQ